MANHICKKKSRFESDHLLPIENIPSENDKEPTLACIHVIPTYFKILHHCIPIFREIWNLWISTNLLISAVIMVTELESNGHCLPLTSAQLLPFYQPVSIWESPMAAGVKGRKQGRPCKKMQVARKWYFKGWIRTKNTVICRDRLSGRSSK